MVKSDETRVVPGEPAGVQKDSATPLPQKPSFLFIATTVLVVLTIIAVTFSAYQGIIK
jgi:hypothetical protein